MERKNLILLSFFFPILFGATVFAETNLSYQYDANGNLVQGEGKYNEYNDANQLVKVRHKDQNGPVIAEYFYDYSGQRIKKIENGVATYYIGKHYEHQVAGSSQANTSYYFANTERVAKKDSSGDLSYYHSDHLGGTNAVTDINGNMVEQVKHYPFGEIREGGIEKYSFTGKEKDKLTDWYYYEARYYNTEIKRFAQADRVIPDAYEPQSLNRYSYVINNPLKYTDPNGHLFTEISSSIQYAASKANQGYQYASKKVSQGYQYASNKAIQGYQYASSKTKQYVVDPVSDFKNDNVVRSFVATDLIIAAAGMGNEQRVYGVGADDTAGSKNSIISSLAIPEKIGNVDTTHAASVHDEEYRIFRQYGAPKWYADLNLYKNIIKDNGVSVTSLKVAAGFYTAVTVGGGDAFEKAAE